MTNITDDRLPFTGVIEMTALVDPVEIGGRALIYFPKYVAEDDALLEKSDEPIRESFLAGIERMYPDFLREQVEAFRISRVRQVMALPTLDYSRNLPPMQTSVSGLHVVNSAQIVNGTLNVNESVKLAEKAVAEFRRLGLPNPILVGSPS